MAPRLFLLALSIWTILAGYLLFHDFKRHIDETLGRKSSLDHYGDLIMMSIPVAPLDLDQMQHQQQQKQQQLASAYQSIRNKRSSSNARSQRIFMDWILDSDSFSYQNYKSLESLLSIFPQHRIECTLLAPDMANYYKFSNMISKHYFMKYAKLGYDIDIVVTKNTKLLGFGLVTDSLGLGAKYFSEEMDKCCQYKQHRDNRKKRIVPLHLYFYSRIAKLFNFGGIFSDFSWLHLPSSTTSTTSTTSSLRYQNISSGVFIASQCFPNGLGKGPSNSAKECISSTLMVFQYPYHPVLHCMLQQFDNVSSDLRRCISSTSNNSINSNSEKRDIKMKKKIEVDTPDGSRLFEDSNCISDAFAECFRFTESINSFEDMYSNDQGQEQSRSHFYPSVKTSVTEFNKDTSRSRGRWRRSDWDKLWMANNFDNINNSNIKVDSLDDHRTVIRKQLLLSSTGVDGCMWMGPLAYAGHWINPQEGSLLHNIFTKKIYLRNGTKLQQPSHGRDNRDQQLVPSAVEITSSFVAPACSHYYYRHTANALNASTSTTAAAAAAAAGVATQASLSCAPSFVLAGFMKSGTTFLWDLLTQHPQVLKALRGVSFKETGCYLPDEMRPRRMHLRMQCFPYVAPGEPFIVGDGTVYYGLRRETPGYLVRDNPRIKAVFMVRAPVDRAMSQHKFMYPTLKATQLDDMNQLVDTALNSTRPFFRLYELAVRADNERSNISRKLERVEELLELFFHGIQAENHYRRAANVLLHSLYFPAIFHWMQILGRDNVLVIRAEELRDPQRLECQLQRLHRFLGISETRLVPFVVDADASQLEEPQQQQRRRRGDLHETVEFVPRQNQANNETRRRLGDFFKPFESLLRSLGTQDGSGSRSGHSEEEKEDNNRLLSAVFV